MYFFSMRADAGLASAMKLFSCIHFPFILSQSAVKEPFVVILTLSLHAYIFRFCLELLILHMTYI